MSAHLTHTHTLARKAINFHMSKFVVYGQVYKLKDIRTASPDSAIVVSICTYIVYLYIYVYTYECVCRICVYPDYIVWICILN